jgi:hypothetical protein
VHLVIISSGTSINLTIKLTESRETTASTRHWHGVTTGGHGAKCLSALEEVFDGAINL